jgi:hypothetical protein
MLDEATAAIDSETGMINIMQFFHHKLCCDVFDVTLSVYPHRAG